MIMRSRKGVLLVYITVTILVFLAIVSLAVDYGRVQLAKTQLRDAADAAALAGAAALGNYQNAQAACVQYAAANTCDGTSVQIDPTQDIEFLNWDPTTRTYTVLTGTDRDSANAIRVWCRRVASRQNAIPLMFARVIGENTCDVSAYSIAAALPAGFGLVGLNSIKLKGNAVASYWSSSGTISGNAGNVASNGDITSQGSSTINGTVWKMPNATVSGLDGNTIRTLSNALSYSSPTAPGGGYGVSKGNILGSYTYNNSTKSFSVGSNQTATLLGGTYVFNNFTVSAGGTLNVVGPTVIYFTGDLNLGGNAVTAGNDPKNLTIYSGTTNANGQGSINIGGGGALYATIMAPESDITLSGNGSIYGSVVGRSIAATGTMSIYYDMSLQGQGGSLALVDVAPVPH